MDVKTVPFQAFPDQKAGTYVIRLPLPLTRFFFAHAPPPTTIAWRGPGG